MCEICDAQDALTAANADAKVATSANQLAVQKLAAGFAKKLDVASLEAQRQECIMTYEAMMDAMLVQHQALLTFEKVSGGGESIFRGLFGGGSGPIH